MEVIAGSSTIFPAFRLWYIESAPRFRRRIRGCRRVVLNRGEDSGNQPAAADRGDDQIRLRQLRQKFAHDRALAGHDHRIVERWM